MSETNTRETVRGDSPSAHGGTAPSPLPSETEAPPPADAKEEPRATNGAANGAETKEGARLLHRGNPLRIARGGVTAWLGSMVAVMLMGHAGQLRFGVPLGTLAVAVASWGVMDLLGTFDDADDRVVASTTLGALTRPLLAFGAALLLFTGALGLAQAGVALRPPVWGVLVTLAFVALTAAVFEIGRALGAWKTDEKGEARPLLKREGFWVVVIAAALYFPFMGTYSLWDPWETHYGEVSREILARDDWISLWWAQDGWFWSKPVLDMWMQAIAMATLGVHYQPDKMLIGNGTAPVMHPEWAVRAPVVLLTIVSMYLLYKGAAMTFGRRAALLGSVVLATMPDWYFLAHQTMTDMPFVAPMAASMGLVMIGLRTSETQEVRAYEVKAKGLRFRLTAWHLVFGAILICGLPQILYLLSRNIEFVWKPGAHGFSFRWDEFRSGSAGGNCGIPGNEECRMTQPALLPKSANPNSLSGVLLHLFQGFEPIIQGVFWAVVLGVVLYLSWGERRARRLAYLGAWFFAAISTLGKGPAGFGLPVLVTLFYLAASRPGEDIVARLLRLVHEIVEFEVVAGLLIVLAVALPWYVAMYVRHGSPFTDRLIFHDMFNRAFSHVHDTNEGDDTSFRFYVWQLGYALFPWTGLAPVGLLWWMQRRGDGKAVDDKADMSILLCMWTVLAFALFSFMGTKFHHYIFPAVPPIALLIGVVLDDMLGAETFVRRGSLPVYLGGLAAAAGLLVVGVSRFLPGSIFGVKPDGHTSDPSTAMAVALTLAGAAVAAFVVLRLRADGSPGKADEDADVTAHRSRMFAAGSVAAALLLVVVGRDLILKPEGSDQPGAIRLLQLFTYNYRRPWPDALDFSAVLAGFTAVGIAISLALAVKSVRRHAVMAMCAFAFLWGLWGLDVYMQNTGQHWGQHEVIAAYYADRSSPSETLVAYQMNWKGENFYTGNHVPAFVSTGTTFTNWLKKQKEAGAKVMYFITEHGRISGLKSEVGAKAYREVTDKTLCNKFVLVRAEL